ASHAAPLGVFPNASCSTSSVSRHTTRHVPSVTRWRDTKRMPHSRMIRSSLIAHAPYNGGPPADLSTRALRALRLPELHLFEDRSSRPSRYLSGTHGPLRSFFRKGYGVDYAESRDYTQPARCHELARALQERLDDGQIEVYAASKAYVPQLRANREETIRN